MLTISPTWATLFKCSVQMSLHAFAGVAAMKPFMYVVLMNTELQQKPRPWKKEKHPGNSATIISSSTMKSTNGLTLPLTNSDALQTMNVRKLLRKYSRTWRKTDTLPNTKTNSHFVQNVSAILPTVL